MRRLSFLLLALAGCPPKSSTPIANPAPVPGVGCPAASGVHLASYLTPGDSGHGHTGWVLPLFDQKVDSLQGQPEYLQLDAARASALGVPAAPPTVWLMLPNAAPCRATAGSYYSAAVGAGPPNVTYGVELSGCAGPPADQAQEAEAIALVSDAPPTECQVATPHPVAARLGSMDAQKKWQRPTQETPLPAPIAALLPPHDCKAPDCEQLWSVAQVDVADKPVAWAGAVNWQQVGAPADPCSWKVEAFSGFFATGPDGSTARITDGQDHPLLLTAVLADKTGPRVLIAEGPGEYATYDFAGGVKLSRHLVWLALGPDAYALDDKLGPQCGPEAGGPAPASSVPASAAPANPYATPPAPARPRR